MRVGERTDVQTTYEKTMIPTGRVCGLAEWINFSLSICIQKKLNKSGDFKVTHQAQCSVFCFHRADKRTDTISESNDHLYGRGLMGQ